MTIKILIQKGKHHTGYYNVSTPALMKGACMKILKEHQDMGYYFDEDKIRAQEILDKKDTKAAYSFVMSRSDHEYEEIETQNLDEYEHI